DRNQLRLISQPRPGARRGRQLTEWRSIPGREQSRAERHGLIKPRGQAARWQLSVFHLINEGDGHRHASRVSVPPSKLIRPRLESSRRRFAGLVRVTVHQRPPEPHSGAAGQDTSRRSSTSLYAHRFTRVKLLNDRNFQPLRVLTLSECGPDNRSCQPTADTTDMTDDRTQALVSGVLDRVRAGLEEELTRLVAELRAQAEEEREEARRQ